MGKEWPYRPDTEDEQKSLHGAWYSNFIYYFCHDQQKLAFIKPTATNDNVNMVSYRFKLTKEAW